MSQAVAAPPAQPTSEGDRYKRHAKKERPAEQTKPVKAKAKATPTPTATPEAENVVLTEQHESETTALPDGTGQTPGGAMSPPPVDTGVVVSPSPTPTTPPATGEPTPAPTPTPTPTPTPEPEPTPTPTPEPAPRLSRSLRRMIEFDDFLAVDMRVGRIVEVADFPEARKPAWKLTIDFGEEIGVKRSSAQITNYSRDQLEGRLVVARGQLPAAPDRPGPLRGADARRLR